MIHEDNISFELDSDIVGKPHFYIDVNIPDMKDIITEIVELEMQPAIFELHTPSGNYDVFQSDECVFFDVTDKLNHVRISAFGKTDFNVIRNLSEHEMDTITNQLFKDVLEYFEEPVGWKR